MPSGLDGRPYLSPVSSSRSRRTIASALVDAEAISRIVPKKDIPRVISRLVNDRAMDLIASITNTTVHMAGALGRPVWTMLPFVAHWRYRRDTGETMWYPHMRLFRQPDWGDWDAVFARVRRELAAMCDGS